MTFLTRLFSKKRTNAGVTREVAECDRCSATVVKGQGFLAYSEAALYGVTTHPITTGVMLMCDTCANELFQERTWNDVDAAQPYVDTFSLSWEERKRELAAGVNPYKRANDVSIVVRSKRMGLRHDQARVRARELAKLWWQDEDAAVTRLRTEASR